MNISILKQMPGRCLLIIHNNPKNWGTLTVSCKCHIKIIIFQSINKSVNQIFNATRHQMHIEAAPNYFSYRAMTFFPTFILWVLTRMTLAIHSDEYPQGNVFLGQTCVSEVQIN